MGKRLIIAIDGPAGSGKSTVARKVAQTLGLLYVDTGAMYRALTLKALDQKIDLKDEGALVALAKETDIQLKTDPQMHLSVLLDGRDVSEAIRESFVTNSVKYVARVAGVRREMVRLQRREASKGGAVLEGRDIGTVVFPDADKKIYLDASVDERAHRRHKELKTRGNEASLENIKKDVIARDRSDMTRDVGPLRKADDAVIIDTTKMTVEEVASRIVSEAHSLEA